MATLVALALVTLWIFGTLAYVYLILSSQAFVFLMVALSFCGLMTAWLQFRTETSQPRRRKRALVKRRLRQRGLVSMRLR